MSTRVWFGQFTIEDGEARPDGPYSGASERLLAGLVDECYVVTNPLTPHAPDHCPVIVRQVLEGYGGEELSVTGGLARAVSAAHWQLLAWNRRSLPEHRALLGAAAVVLREDRCYACHAGPVGVYLHQDGVVDLLAPAGAAGSARGGLGSDGAAPQMAVRPVASGARLLMCSEPLSPAELAALPGILALDPQEALAELYLMLRDRPRAAVMLAAVLAAPAGRRAVRGDTTLVQIDTAPPPDQPALRRRRGLPLRRRGLQQFRTTPSAWDAVRARLRVPLLALGTLLLLLVLVAAVRGLRGGDNGFSSAVDAAQADLARATSAADVATKRELLVQADDSLSKALALRPADARARQVQQQLEQAFRAIIASSTLTGATPLADLAAAGIAPRDVTGMAWTDRPYLLNGANGSVYALPDAPPASTPQGEPPPTTVFSPGQVVDGRAAGKALLIAVGRPLGIMRPPELLVYDDHQQLYSYAGGSAIHGVALPPNPPWKSVTGLAYGAQALYVLDAAGNQVWRVPETKDGFAGQPQPLLTKVDLADATGIAVGTDIYVTGSTTPLRRFGPAGALPFQIHGLLRPLEGPLPPIPEPSSGLLYVVDRGGKRLVVLDESGTLRAEYTSPEMGALAWGVVKPGQAICFVAGQLAYLLKLPS